MSFSGYPKTEWQGERDMVLLEEISFIDSGRLQWKVPVGAHLNGATIPRALWSSLGSPFVGKYRRATVIHDYFVGENTNPNVSDEDRKRADRMFYEACRADGCSRRFAAILYAGVRFGTWMAGDRYAPLEDDSPFESRSIRDGDRELRKQFWECLEGLEEELESGDLDAIDRRFEDRKPKVPDFPPELPE